MILRKFLFFFTISLSVFLSGCLPYQNSAYLSSALPQKNREAILESALSQIEGIEDIRVLLWGNTALIGFLPKEGVEPEELYPLIRAKALETDKEVFYVSVSKNPRIVKRIGNI